MHASLLPPPGCDEQLADDAVCITDILQSLHIHNCKNTKIWMRKIYFMRFSQSVSQHGTFFLPELSSPAASWIVHRSIWNCSIHSAAPCRCLSMSEHRACAEMISDSSRKSESAGSVDVQLPACVPKHLRGVLHVFIVGYESMRLEGATQLGA